FQADDGIRGFHVTGVQTCALPIFFLLGQVENPFALMKKCDCFVLSSHYEGQPMVLLEAMTLGMNIIATDIVANRTVLENGKYGQIGRASCRERGHKTDGDVPGGEQ